MACGLALKRPLELEPYSLSPEGGAKRPRISAAQHWSPSFLNSLAQSNPTPTSTPSTSAASPFVNHSPLSRTQLESYLQAEIRSLRRRKLLPKQRGAKFRPRSPGHSSDSDNDPAPSSAPAKGEELPTFTFKQVRMMCERLLKEQESQLRCQYDSALNAKLAEQYEQFVKFTQDQIHRQVVDAQPSSYLS